MEIEQQTTTHQVSDSTKGWFLMRFLRAAALTLHSFKYTWQEKELRNIAIWPIPITMVLLFGFYSAAFSYFDISEAISFPTIDPEQDWRIFHQAWAVVKATAIIVLVGMVSVILSMIFGNILCSPLYDILSMRAERLTTGIKLESPFQLSQLIRSIIVEIKFQGLFILVYLLGLAVLFLIGLIPLIGQVVGPVLGWFWTCLIFSIELHSVPMARHGVLARQRMTQLFSNKASHAGLGAVGSLIAFIPGTMPFLVVAASRLYTSHIVYQQAPSQYSEEQLRSLR